MTLQLLGERIEGPERRPRGEGQPFVQAGKVQVGAVAEDRGKAGEPNGATESQIEEARGILHPLRLQSPERHVIDRDHRRHQPDAAEERAPRSPNRW
jgi:hypothetical protein